MLSRNQYQEKLMFIIYQMLFLSRIEQEFDIKELMCDTLECDYEDVPVFVKEVSIKCALNFSEIYEMIVPHCSTWKIDRINMVSIACIMLAITEFKYVGDVDKAVIIDVAIKLCKKYAGEKDYRFVNAVLDKIL